MRAGPVGRGAADPGGPRGVVGGQRRIARQPRESDAVAHFAGRPRKRLHACEGKCAAAAGEIVEELAHALRD